jgi:hypothetical protein
VRVTIRTREQDGLLPSKKLYFTDCTVLFSEEEKAIVQARGLGQHYFVVGSEVPPPRGSHRLLSIWLRALAPVVLLGGIATSFLLLLPIAIIFGIIAFLRWYQSHPQPYTNVAMVAEATQQHVIAANFPLRRSRVERPRRSSRITVSTSPASSWSSNRACCARSVFAPLTTSRKTFSAPAAVSAGGGQRRDLRVDALAVRRYPCIAVDHATILHV